PFAYGTSVYMFIHNLLALASGHMSAGYWIGTYLCLLFFGNIPKLIREVRRGAKGQHETLSPEKAGGSLAVPPPAGLRGDVVGVEHGVGTGGGGPETTSGGPGLSR